VTGKKSTRSSPQGVNWKERKKKGGGGTIAYLLQTSTEEEGKKGLSSTSHRLPKKKEKKSMADKSRFRPYPKKGKSRIPPFSQEGGGGEEKKKKKGEESSLPPSGGASNSTVNKKEGKRELKSPNSANRIPAAKEVQSLHLKKGREGPPSINRGQGKATRRKGEWTSLRLLPGQEEKKKEGAASPSLTSKGRGGRRLRLRPKKTPGRLPRPPHVKKKKERGGEAGNLHPLAPKERKG